MIALKPRQPISIGRYRDVCGTVLHEFDHWDIEGRFPRAITRCGTVISESFVDTSTKYRKCLRCERLTTFVAPSAPETDYAAVLEASAQALLAAAHALRSVS